MNNAITIPLDQFEVQPEMSNNVKDYTIGYTYPVLNLSINSYNTSSAYTWLRLELSKNVSFADYPSVFLDLNGSQNSFFNLGFGNSSQPLCFVGETSTGQKNYVFSLTNLKQTGSNVSYNDTRFVWLAISGNGESSYSFNVSAIIFFNLR